VTGYILCIEKACLAFDGSSIDVFFYLSRSIVGMEILDEN